jgi:hypothetical protein
MQTTVPHVFVLFNSILSKCKWRNGVQNYCMHTLLVSAVSDWRCSEGLKDCCLFLFGKECVIVATEHILNMVIFWVCCGAMSSGRSLPTFQSSFLLAWSGQQVGVAPRNVGQLLPSFWAIQLRRWPAIFILATAENLKFTERIVLMFNYSYHQCWGSSSRHGCHCTSDTISR